MSNDLNSSSQTFSKNMGLRLIAYIIDSAITVGILMINYITLSIVSSISPNPEKLGEIGVAIISASIILTFITGFVNSEWGQVLKNKSGYCIVKILWHDRYA